MQGLGVSSHFLPTLEICDQKSLWTTGSEGEILVSEWFHCQEELQRYGTRGSKSQKKGTVLAFALGTISDITIYLLFTLYFKYKTHLYNNLKMPTFWNQCPLLVNSFL